MASVVEVQRLVVRITGEAKGVLKEVKRFKAELDGLGVSTEKISQAQKKATEAEQEVTRARKTATAFIRKEETSVERLNRELLEFTLAAQKAGLSQERFAITTKRMTDKLNIAASSTAKVAGLTKGLNQPLIQAAFAVEDATVVWGTQGLTGAIRAASNNLTQIIFLVTASNKSISAWVGPAAIMGIVLAGFIIPKVIEFLKVTTEEIRKSKKAAEDFITTLSKLSQEMRERIRLEKILMKIAGVPEPEGTASQAVGRGQERIRELRAELEGLSEQINQVDFDMGQLQAKFARGMELQVFRPFSQLLLQIEAGNELREKEIERLDLTKEFREINNKIFKLTQDRIRIEVAEAAKGERRKAQELVKKAVEDTRTEVERLNQELERSQGAQRFAETAEQAEGLARKIKETRDELFKAEENVRAFELGFKDAANAAASLKRDLEKAKTPVERIADRIKELEGRKIKFALDKTQLEAINRLLLEAERKQLALNLQFKSTSNAVSKVESTLRKSLTPLEAAGAKTRELARQWFFVFFDTKGTVEQLDNINKAIGENRKHVEALEQGFKGVKDRTRQVEALIKRLETPLEKFNRRIRETQKLLPALIAKVGESKAMEIVRKDTEAAKEELEKAGNAADRLKRSLQGVQAVASGSAEAFARIREFMEGKGVPKTPERAKPKPLPSKMTAEEIAKIPEEFRPRGPVSPIRRPQFPREMELRGEEATRIRAERQRRAQMEETMRQDEARERLARSEGTMRQDEARRMVPISRKGQGGRQADKNLENIASGIKQLVEIAQEEQGRPKIELEPADFEGR